MSLMRPDSHTAPNYSPLPVVIASGDGAWVTDVDGKRYLDALSGYSSLNFGHGHPDLLRVAREQLSRLTLTSRAFQHDQFEDFTASLARLCRKEAVLPMNSGAEAVESAIKAARRWAYDVKGVTQDDARIVAVAGNFHGRTTTIVSFSTDPVARRGFGPFTPGFDVVPFGDVEALQAAITPETAAVLLEPVQGEAGVVLPPKGYLSEVRQICSDTQTLMIADEIQSGLGRTGETFACDHEDVLPDVYILGKALGGGIVPLSAVVADHEILDVLTPGSHGSTFGGNPLACSVGREVVRLLSDGHYQRRAAALGERLASNLASLPPTLVDGIRTIGLWAGVDLAAGRSGREVSLGLMRRGVLAKETHGTTLRLAPPLVIEEAELDWMTEQLAAAMGEE